MHTVKRAAVFIGVDRVGGMPPLKDAARGVRRMEQWARSQKIDVIEVFTDENDSSVEVGSIKKAIKRIVESGNIDQLIVYFAGHGVNIRYGEYWLLSDAPSDTQAAVNVQGSEVLARYAGIPHVVFFSDACRTAAEGIRAQLVTGSEIFPNEGADALEKPVDQFFACTLGRPAHEIRDPNTTTREFSALYTDALVAAVRGNDNRILDWISQGTDRFALVRPRQLKEYLLGAITARLKDLNLQTKIIQVPDARITSSNDAWVSRVLAGDIDRDAAPAPIAATTTIAMVSASLLRTALTGDSTKLRTELDNARATSGAPESSLIRTFERAAVPFGPMHHESKCGFKIRGAKIVEAVSTGAETELFTIPGDVVRVNTLRYPGASVLVVLEEGSGVVLPAIPEFLAALTVEDGELVDVAYEPSDNTPRWQDFQQYGKEVRTLRALAASSTKNGVFRLEGEDALGVARRLQYAKSIDPTLAVYAAYAYQDLRRGDLIREMSGYMRGDLGGRLFDIALLARELDAKTVGAVPEVFGIAPLLSQGWALLGAHRVTLPPSLNNIEQTLLPSVWTLFDDNGVAQLRAAFQKGEIR
jgi:caspase domain-containing protein